MMLAPVMRLAFLFLLFPILLFGEISYTVDFEGLDDVQALKAIKATSQLINLYNRPPPSVSALRFRAESDSEELVRVLHAYGYYEAKVQVEIAIDHLENYRVKIKISPGPLYVLAQYQVHIESEKPDLCPQFHLEELGLVLGQPIISQEILDAETEALRLLSECGYPLSKITDRSVIADGKTKTVFVNLQVKAGPLCYFGSHCICGNSTVLDKLINQKIVWQCGCVYDSRLVEKTQKALMSTGLFCSVGISHDQQVDEKSQLPMQIELIETKHKCISLGASYQKTFGAGGTIGWENRNIGGMGRQLSLQADVTQRSHLGMVCYLIPNAGVIGQDFSLRAEEARESITAYRDQSYQLGGLLDRRFNKYFCASLGIQTTFLAVRESVDNGNFLLLESPIALRWSTVCDFLNPIKGMTFECKITPSVNCKDNSDFYSVQYMSLSSYLPIAKEDLFVLAQRGILSFIFSNGIDAIPVPRRLFGGSEETLRGYKYLTVSPLTHENKPIGGRFAFFYNLEVRLRFGDFGLVPFFDLGTVGIDSWASFQSKWRKSVGLGFRYFSFAGPLRLDVAFPIDRRKHLDPPWWIFVSIGQAF